MKRKVKTKVKGFRTTDGAGVKLVRVLGNLTTKEFDPILMLDSFDSINPDDYTAGFPMHLLDVIDPDGNGMDGTKSV